MSNACSQERAFDCNRGPGHRRVTILVVLTGLCLFANGCVADPQRAQTAALLDRIAAVRVMLQQNPPPTEACVEMGDIETRLYGEPGLVEVQPAWSQLANAAHALQAVCGQSALLAQPITGSAALEVARADWQAGIRHETDMACEYLRAAAAALDRRAPC
jgi:hypothetical protein